MKSASISFFHHLIVRYVSWYDIYIYIYALANPFPRPANLAPHFCFHLCCLPLSFLFDHFVLTLEFPFSRATRYISDPSIVQGPRCFPCAFPISRNEGTRSTYRKSIFRVPPGTRFELLFERRKKGDTFGGSKIEGKKMRGILSSSKFA